MVVAGTRHCLLSTTTTMEKYQNKYRISSAHLQTWDYGSNAAYFITICSKNRKHYFGEIVDKKMELNETGKLAYQFWIEIPVHFPFIELGNFVVMPNHMHGILIIDKNNTNVETGQCPVSTNTNPDTNKIDKTPGQLRFQNQGKNTISSIVGSYKSVVSKHAHKIHSGFAWQSRFHDHIIHDAKSFERIRHYIANNPANWKDDKFYS